MIVAVLEEVGVAAVLAGPVVVPPMTIAPPVVVGDAEPKTSVPVQTAPMGQHAILFALSLVHVEPAIQHAPP